jgi:hypothetical protein
MSDQSIFTDSKIILPSDLAVRKWDSGKARAAHCSKILFQLTNRKLTLVQVINPHDDWQTNKFTVRRRIFVLERLLEEEVHLFHYLSQAEITILQVKNDPKSAQLVVLEQQLSLALGLSLKYLQREHEDIYSQLYDTEAEVEALEIEQNRLQKLLQQKKDRLELVQETNSLLTTRLDVEKMRANTEVQWKAKLEEEARLRAALEKTLLKLQEEVLAVKTEY